MREQDEPALAEVLARLAPADLVLIEGFKRERHPKIEVRSGAGEASAPPMAPTDPSILAIAADQPIADQRLPWFRRDDIASIADFIADQRQR
jgi:molybdopterin-guanine dinucleotide biosynthesis protein B